MPEIVRYFEKSPEAPGAYVEVIREDVEGKPPKIYRGRLFRVAKDSEFAIETAYVPDMHTPVRLVPMV